MVKINKNCKGITLVALIVTIIILLILAGISIASLTENGLLEKAKFAKEKQENVQIEEKTKLSDYESKVGEYVDGNREKITVDKNEYEQLLKDVSDIKKQINTTETWTKLCSTNSTSVATLKIENINNYKYVVVVMQPAASKNIYASALIPIETFKNGTTGYFASSSATSWALAKYVSDESVSMYTDASSNYAVLYGIK